jgi:hypothetical protein
MKLFGNFFKKNVSENSKKEDGINFSIQEIRELFNSEISERQNLIRRKQYICITYAPNWGGYTYQSTDNKCFVAFPNTEKELQEYDFMYQLGSMNTKETSQLSEKEYNRTFEKNGKLKRKLEHIEFSTNFDIYSKLGKEGFEVDSDLSFKKLFQDINGEEISTYKTVEGRNNEFEITLSPLCYVNVWHNKTTSEVIIVIRRLLGYETLSAIFLKLNPIYPYKYHKGLLLDDSGLPIERKDD